MIKIRSSDQLLLRQIEADDAEVIFNTINTQRTYLRKWLPFVDYTREIGDTRQFIRSIYQNQELVFVIEYKDDFAGLIGFRNIDRQNRKAEIGYWLSEPFQHKGIMTESVKLLVKYAFDKLQLNRIVINCATANNPSRNIPRKLGFRFEGVERDGELLSDGKFVDIERYSLCRSRDNVNF